MPAFFGQHGKFSASGGDFEVAEQGVYTCRLADVIAEQRASFDDPAIQEDQFRFVFETTEATDSQGNPYKFIKFTKTFYGNEKANLTLTIDAMLGRHLTQEEFAALDLDVLKTRQYKVMVNEHTTGAGKVVNKILSIKPVNGGNQAAKPKQTFGAMTTGRSLPAPSRGSAVPPEDDLSGLDDPFAYS